MISEHLQEQAALYALGAISAQEARAFEQLLPSDPELQQLVMELRTAADAVAGTAPLVTPPPELKQKILDRIDSPKNVVQLPTPSAVSRQPVIWLPWALAACFAILCVVLVQRESTLNARVNELNQLAQNLENSTNTLQQAVAALEKTNQIANMQIAMLGSLLSDQPKAVAVSLWDEQKQAGVFVVQNLKTLPNDKDYQLWVIDNKPVSAGVIRVDANGKARIEFKADQPIKTAGKFAVSEEAKGGSTTDAGPKGQIVLISD